MTEHGGKISEIPVELLQEKLLNETEDAKAIKRLFTAIEYKHGRSPADIEERYGFPRQTIYTWLDRFEDRDFEDALYDDKIPGRTQNLSKTQLAQLENILKKGPENYGFTGQRWTGKRVARIISEEFDTSISPKTARRYLRQLGWSNKKPKRVAVEREPESIEEFRNKKWVEIRNKAKQKGNAVVFVDETKFRLLPNSVPHKAP